MTHEEYLAKILNGLNCCELAASEIKLLDLAFEITLDEYSEENFDRVALLVDCYRSRYLGLLDEIEGSLRWTEEYLRLLISQE